MAIEFKAWPKIPRIANEKYFITEKIDGTNACVIIDEEGNFGCQSRSKLITPEDDNYGFARWAYENKDELMKLGEGHHYGEWWGQGIQRTYGLSEKRFSLFNTARWNPENPNLPACCHVVPLIEGTIDEALEKLKSQGSVAAPGFMRVEGIIVYSYLAKSYYKVIIDK
jgi:hypothetical protein